MILDQKPLDTSDQTTRYMQASGPGASVLTADEKMSSASTPIAELDGSKTAAQMNSQEYFSLYRQAQSEAVRYIDATVRAKWARSMKAYHNQHFQGSKYLSDQWRSRSKLFRPKTRVAVRKHMANFAKAMFGSQNVIAITPQDETDPDQVASAAMKQKLVDYRLDRKSRRNAIPWTTVALGARQDSLIHGICISKQTWSYIVEKDDDDPEKEHVIEDRPEIFLYPPENVLFHPLCDWRNPAQTSEYLILRQQLSVSEVISLVQSGKRGPMKFDQELTKAKLLSMRGNTTRNVGSSDTVQTRAARHDGADPNQTPNNAAPNFWVSEVFFRIDGKDMVFWVLDDKMVMSTPISVRKAYPHMKGERPVVVGYGAIEAHRALPMAPVEALQPLQAEINDQVNLRLDHMKQVVTPLAKVQRGRNIDIKAVQSRGGNNGVVLVQNKDDIDWAQIPDLPQSAYVENQYLNADFDDLAGTFNSGSVQTNRSLNETVGGMKLLAGDASQIGDFDTMIFIETWAEGVIWQVVKAIEYFETDATVLELCGKRAQLVERYGITDITDEFLMKETHVSIKIGVSTANLPTERLQKFGMATTMFGQISAPFIEKGRNKMPAIKLKEVANTIFGDAGIPDAAERFFTDLDDEPAPEQQQGPPPEVQAAQAKAQIEQAKGQNDIQIAREKMEMERESHQQDMQMQREKFQNQQAIDAQKAQHQQNMQAQQMQVSAVQAHQQLQTGAAVAQQKLQQGDMAARQKMQHADMTAQARTKAIGAPAPAPAPAPAAGGGEISQLAEAILAIAQQQAQTNALLAELVAGGGAGAPAPSGVPM